MEFDEFFGTCKVLVIGDVMIDAYLWGDVNRISPEAPVPVLSCIKRENRLGGAGNVVINLKAMGAIPLVVSVVGDDEQGVLLKTMLSEDYGVNSDYIIVSEQRRTTVKTRIISQGQHLLRVDDEMDSLVAIDETLMMEDTIAELLDSGEVSAVVFEDYDKGVITPRLIEFVVEQCAEREIPVLADPKSRNFNAYHGITVYKPNFKEFCSGLNVNVKKGDINQLMRIADEFRMAREMDYLLITLSEHGMLLCGAESEHIAAQRSEIVDVSGAGDTVISVFTVCLAAGIDAFTATRIANVAGGQVCQKVGVVPVDKVQLYEECKRLNIII